MKIERRKFLEHVAGVCTAGLGRNLLASAMLPATAAAAAAPAAAAATTAAASLGVAAGLYGSGVRAQVLEVIVRQGIAGAPWRAICAGPMSVNNITEAEVEQEMARRFEHNVNPERCVCQLCRNDHRDIPECVCPKCKVARQARDAYIYKELLAVAHSEKSPCFCMECRTQSEAFLRKLRMEAVEKFERKERKA